MELVKKYDTVFDTITVFKIKFAYFMFYQIYVR